MPDQELAVQEKPKKWMSYSWYFIAIIALSGEILKSIFKIDFSIGASIGLLIASVVEYYIEHPEESFTDWLKKHLRVATFLFCAWLGPVLLSHWFSSPWTYGIFGFSCVILSYFVRTIIKRKDYLSLTPAQRKKEALVVLLLGVVCSFVMALLSFIPKLKN